VVVVSSVMLFHGDAQGKEEGVTYHSIERTDCQSASYIERFLRYYKEEKSMVEPTSLSSLKKNDQINLIRKRHV
jgi:hypothetical protein